MPVEKERRFGETPSIQVAIPRELLHDGKSVGCGTGENEQKQFSCSTHTSWLVNAIKQQLTRNGNFMSPNLCSFSIGTNSAMVPCDARQSPCSLSC